MLNRIRIYINSLINPIARIFIKIGLTPNIASIMGLIFSIIASVMIIKNKLIYASALIILSGFFDVIDGAIARISNKASKFGSFFDSMIDRYADAIILSSIIFSSKCEILPGLIAMVGSLLVSYARAKGESLGVNMAGIGLAERAERLIIISIGLFLNMMNYAIILLAFLTHLTVLIRSYKAWSILRGEKY